LTTPLPPADDLQPDQPLIAAPLNGGDLSSPQPPPAALAAGRWTSSEIFLGFSTIAVLVSLFLPWFGVTSAGSGVGGSMSGTGAHGYLWLVFALGLVVLLVLVIPDFIARAPVRLPSSQQLIVGASTLSFLLVLLAFIAKPTASASGALFASTGAGVDWTYGAFIALIAAILAFLTALGTGGVTKSPGVRARAS
jgi:hypothetical protein